MESNDSISYAYMAYIWKVPLPRNSYLRSSDRYLSNCARCSVSFGFRNVSTMKFISDSQARECRIQKSNLKKRCRPNCLLITLSKKVPLPKLAQKVRVHIPAPVVNEKFWQSIQWEEGHKTLWTRKLQVLVLNFLRCLLVVGYNYKIC